jgi:SAM-dependent methyltransferase
LAEEDPVRGGVQKFQVGAMKITLALQERLICPHCRAQLCPVGESFVCKNCGNDYPVIGGIPILIDENVCGFRISGYARPRELTKAERAKRALRSVLPAISLNLAAKRNYQQFREMLLRLNPHPRVLIVGGATAGAGTSELLADERIEFVESDIAIDDRTTLVCDAHALPFADQTFDGVIFQAVMFYLQDYQRCISEMFRVLKPEGIIYSESAFMEQVVGGEYDFYRFTLRGHEYQFRQFERISSGISGGPAMATAWSIQYLLLSFTESAAIRAAIRIFCKCTLFWMKYLDLLLVRKRGAVDAAAGTFFMGRRPAEEVAPERVAVLPQRAEEQPAQGQPAQPEPTPVQVPQYQGLIQSDVRAYR